MELLRSLKPELVYAKRMATAGWNGIVSTRQEFNRNLFTPATTADWIPTMIGGGIGLSSGFLMGKRRSSSRVALSALLGSVVGFSAGLAWRSRHVTGNAARRSMRLVNEVRDTRWLERHPIDYA